MKKTNGKSITYIYIIVMYLFTFQCFLQQYIKYFTYFDEIFSVMIIPMSIVYIMKNKNTLKIKKDNFIIIALLIVIFIIGIYGNLKYNYQTIGYVLADILLVYKFFMVYFLTTITFKDKIKYEKLISKHVKFLIIFLFTGTVIDYIFKINLYQEIRWGIHPNAFIYGHPTGLAAIGIYLLSNHIRFSKKILDVYSIIIIIVIASTLRMKAIGFCVAFIIIALYVENKNKKIKFSKFVTVGIALCIVASEQLSFYFFENQDVARNELAIKSIEIAIDHIPIGTGFGTFGSYFSGVSYSPLYYTYGLNTTYGLAEGNAWYLSDNFWPMILGQFGFFGTTLYCICLFLIFKKIQIEYLVERKHQYLARMLCLVYLLISSIAESAFVNPLSIPLAIMIAV